MPEMPFPSLMQAIALGYKAYKDLRIKIADSRDDGVLIYPPDRKGAMLNLPVGGRVAMRFFDEESAYEFYSTVLQRIDEPFLSYLLRLSSTGKCYSEEEVLPAEGDGFGTQLLPGFPEGGQEEGRCCYASPQRV